VAVTNARLQASDMRLGSGRANQFGSCPKLPTWTKPTPLSLAHSFKPRSMAIILLSNSGAGSAILGGSFILFRLGIALPTADRGIWFPTASTAWTNSAATSIKRALMVVLFLRRFIDSLFHLARYCARIRQRASNERWVWFPPSPFKRPAARRFIDSPSRVQRRTLSHHRHINNCDGGHKTLA